MPKMTARIHQSTTPAIASAYVLALLSLMLPLAVVGATFAAIVLWQRGLRAHGATVFALGVAGVVLGVVVLR